jgi:hypothetical protein
MCKSQSNIPFIKFINLSPYYLGGIQLIVLVPYLIDFNLYSNYFFVLYNCYNKIYLPKYSESINDTNKINTFPILRDHATIIHLKYSI